MTTIYSHHVYADGTEGFSGISGGDPVEAFVQRLASDGHAIVGDGGDRHSWRRVCSKFSHDDAKFAEAGTSQAAYYENEDAFGGRWMENPRLTEWLTDGRVA